MLLKDYFPKVDKKLQNISFSGISFDSSKLKKNNIFLQLRATLLTVINLYQLQLKKGQKLLSQKIKSKKRLMEYYIFDLKILES